MCCKTFPKAYHAFTYIIGIIFGFPIGAKLTADFCSKGYIDKNHREILSALANHFSLPFIITYALSEQLNICSHYSIYLVSLYLPSAIGMIAILSINKNKSLTQKSRLKDLSLTCKSLMPE